MSLARTALRLAAIAALEADPVVAALCPDRIFDSLIDELDVEKDKAVPVIVVFTDDDVGRPWSANNGGPPFDHACDLLLEVSMRTVTRLPSTDGKPQAVLLGAAETDSQMEAVLDLLEERAIEAVTIADTPQARLIRTSVVRRATQMRSIRYASADTGAKVAMRLATLTVHLKVHEPDLLNPPIGPFATLPEPLRSVALAQPVDSPGYATCLAVAAELSPRPAGLLTGFDVVLQPLSAFDPAHPPTRPDPAEPDPTAPDPISTSIGLSAP